MGIARSRQDFDVSLRAWQRGLRMALSPTASGLAAIYDGATRTEATKMAALVIEVRVWLRRSPNVEATSS